MSSQIHGCKIFCNLDAQKAAWCNTAKYTSVPTRLNAAGKSTLNHRFTAGLATSKGHQALSVDFTCLHTACTCWSSPAARAASVGVASGRLLEPSA